MTITSACLLNVNELYAKEPVESRDLLIEKGQKAIFSGVLVPEKNYRHYTNLFDNAELMESQNLLLEEALAEQKKLVDSQPNPWLMLLAGFVAGAALSVTTR